MNHGSRGHSWLCPLTQRNTPGAMNTPLTFYRPLSRINQNLENYLSQQMAGAELKDISFFLSKVPSEDKITFQEYKNQICERLGIRMNNNKDRLQERKGFSLIHAVPSK